MPANLMALVDQLIAVTRDSDQDGEKGSSGFGRSGLEEGMLSAWSGSPRRSADQVSAYLADTPDMKEAPSAYRLWIEMLAEAGDTAGLKSLGEHLFLRGQADPKAHESFAALRGLVHLELDEMSAATLLAHAMVGLAHNAFCQELVQRVESRTAQAPVEIPALLTVTTPMTDYYHWQTLARALLVGREEAALAQVLSFVAEQFPAATLPHLFEYHRLVEQQLYAGAALVAERLVQMYPENVDFRYYQAYSMFEDGDYPAARRLLNETIRKVGEADPELVGLLGHCNAKLGDPERAEALLTRATQMLQAEGLPYSHLSLELSTVQDEMRTDETSTVTQMPRVARKWLVNLSPRRYHEFAVASESTIDRLLRPMGNEPRPGDLCFFATTSKFGGQNQWRIVGVYAVDSEPMWHPTRRFHSALKLISRLPVGIPVDVEAEDDQQATAPSSPDAPINFGVYELDNYAIDIIEETVRLSRDEMIERRTGNGQSRRPTA